MQVTYLTQANKLFVAPVPANHYENQVTNLSSPIRPLLRPENLLELSTPRERAPQAIVIRFGEKSFLAIDPMYVGTAENTRRLGKLTIQPGDVILVGDLSGSEHDVFTAPLPGVYTVWLRRYVMRSCGADTFEFFSHELILVDQSKEDLNLDIPQQRSHHLGLIFRTASLGFVLYNPAILEDYIRRVGTSNPLLDKFTSTDDGEQLIAQGAIIPVLGIQSRTYRLIVRRSDDEPSDKEWLGESITPPRKYALTGDPTGAIVLADADILLSWEPDRAICTFIPVGPGPKCAEIVGYVKVSRRWNVPIFISYEIILSDTEQLPRTSDEPLINEDLFVLYSERA
jgi:hypothetical protein